MKKSNRQRKLQRRNRRERRAKEMQRVVLCPYCGNRAEFIGSSASVYHGKDYGPLWICKTCEAWVGCHKGTRTPLGRLANAELRKMKMMAHNAFDAMWRSGGMTRSEAYNWLTKALGLTTQAHIGEMDCEDCRRVIDAVYARNISK